MDLENLKWILITCEVLEKHNKTIEDIISDILTNYRGETGGAIK